MEQFEISINLSNLLTVIYQQGIAPIYDMKNYSYN